MSIEGKGVSVDGTTVTIRTDSEATARDIGAAAERERLANDGTRGERSAAWFDGWLTGAGKWFDKLDARLLHLVSWAAALVGMFIGWQAGQNLSAVKNAGIFFSVAFVALVFAGKYAAGRWGRDARAKRDSQNAWQAVTIAAFVLCVISGSAVQIGAEANQDSGRAALVAQNNILKAEISGLQAQIFNAEDDLSFPASSSKVLQRSFEAALARDPRRADGQPSGKALGEWVDYGTDTFCRGSSYYKNEFCPDLIDQERALLIRIDYETAQKALAQKREQQVGLLVQIQSSSQSTFGAVSNRMGGEILILILIGLLITLMVDGVAFGTAFMAYRYPEEK